MKEAKVFSIGTVLDALDKDAGARCLMGEDFGHRVKLMLTDHRNSQNVQSST